jgi:hypothetical protein
LRNAHGGRSCGARAREVKRTASKHPANNRALI